MAGGWRTAAFVAALLAVSAPLAAGASMPFSPAVDIFVTSPAPSANSNVRIATSLPAGHHPLSSWNFFLPDGWNVSGDNAVFNGEVVARGAMSIDVDCDGTVQSYGPFDLVDTPLGGGDVPVAQWNGQITSWWDLLITVEQLPGEPMYFSADLTNFSVFHTTCAPQSFVVTVLGRSLPRNDVVITNPSSAATYTWEGSFSSSGGHMANVLEPVCVGTGCDRDADGVADVTDNCDTWPNPAQSPPPWPVAADDPDCDGFGSSVEDPAGTSALVQCGFNAWPADVNNDSFVDVIGDISALTNNFAVPVPPGPYRHNISPDPPDGFIDIFDISAMSAFFGRSCAACPGDFDCDLVPNASDNCPNWPNPTQALPPWPVPPNDPDCDGFSTTVENPAGTAPLIHCGANAWPADINNDTFVDVIGDISALTNNFAVPVPPGPARYNISPDPPDGFIDIFDISKMTAFFGFTCV